MPGGIDGFDSIDTAPSAQTLAEQTSDLSYGMRRVLERLSAEERAAFLLREAFEADYASIAKILNRSAAHCRQMVHRAKDRVRDERTCDGAQRSPQGNPRNLPALINDERKLANSWMYERHPNLKTGRRRGSSFNDHSAEGRRAADGVSLSAQVTGQRRSSHLIGSS